MNNQRVTTGILGLFLMTLLLMSCKENKNEETKVDHQHSEMKGSLTTMGETMDMDDQKTLKHMMIVDNYLKLKNALVNDDKEEASKIGETLVTNFESFDIRSFSVEQQKELTEIIEDAKEHAEHIANSPIDHQREHFETLSKDVVDLIAITGTGKTLYQDFCPMFNNNKGGMWLSETKEIRNPYFGSKMLTCGSVQKVFE